MLWFQYWGEDIPSFTEFWRFCKNKTARVVKLSYQETFSNLKLIIKSLFYNLAPKSDFGVDTLPFRRADFQNN